MVGITAFGAVLAGRRLYHPCKTHKSDIVVILDTYVAAYLQYSSGQSCNGWQLKLLKHTRRPSTEQMPESEYTIMYSQLQLRLNIAYCIA